MIQPPHKLIIRTALFLSSLIIVTALLAFVPPWQSIIPISTGSFAPPSATSQITVVSDRLDTLAVASPSAAVQNAWRKASHAEAFHFATDLIQTTHPAPALTNVGRSSRSEAVRIEGEIDRPADLMSMTLWGDSGHLSNSQNALAIRIQNGVTEGRVGDAAWQPIDNVADTFAPNGDFLTFLSGAANIRRVEEPNAIAAMQQYAFDLNGPQLATYLRQQLEAQLRAKGELPNGISLATPNIIHGAEGTGAIWLDASGLPRHLSLQVALPQQANGERTSITIRSDFSHYQLPDALVTVQSLQAAPLHTVTTALANSFTPETLQLGGLVMALLTLTLLILRNRSRVVHRGLTLTIIVSMNVVPLLQSQQVYAFFDKQQIQVAAMDQAEETSAQEQQLLDQLYADTWDAHRDPLAADSTITERSSTENEPARAIHTIDPNPVRAVNSSPAAQQAATPNATSDEDSDGLTAAQEAMLGTDPKSADSDGDLIKDKAEVDSFSYNGKQWYTNPLAVDSNNDSLSDTEECPERVNNAAGICRDTDGDGTPDIFDHDNDNDNVPDRIDLSPNEAMGSNGTVTNLQPFTQTTPLNFQLNNLQKPSTNAPGYHTMVDFQLRPTDVDHLWYALNVYDWPDSDDQGQIRRSLPTATDEKPDATEAQEETTFATFDGNDIGNNANGDVRLVPMLEVTMSGTPLPLPLTTPKAEQPFAGNAITGTVALAVAGDNTNFRFDFTSTSSYTATVVEGSCVGTTALQTATVTDNGTFTVAKNLLTLADGNHVVRLVDQADPAKDKPRNALCFPLIDLPNGAYTDKMIDTSFLTPYGISIRDITAETVSAYVPLSLITDPVTGERAAFGGRMPYRPDDPTNWGKAHEIKMVWLVTMLTPDGGTTVVHAYDDAWTLTGLSVREDRGAEMAVAFEDPATNSASGDGAHLLVLARGLERSFLGGRDSDKNGTLDIRVSTIKERFDNKSNGSSTEVTRWKLPKDAFRVSTFSYAQNDEVAKVSTTEIQTLLDAHFLDGTTPKAQTPLLLFAGETRFRQLNLSTPQSTASLVTATGNALTLDLDPNKVTERTFASLNWMPYQYQNERWQNYPLQEYADKLTVGFQEAFASSKESERPAEVMLMKSQYLALTVASKRLVKLDNVPAATEEESADSNLSDELGGLVGDGSGIINTISGELAETAFETAFTLRESYEATDELLAELPFFNDTPKPSFAKESITKAISTYGNGWADAFRVGDNVNKKAAGAFAVAAVGLTVYLTFAGGQESTGQAVIGGMTSVNTIMATRDLITAVKEFGEAGAEVASAGAKAVPIAGLALEIGIVWGLAIAQLALDSVELFGVQFLDVVAGAIASTIVAVIMFAIAAIPVVGQIIAAIIAAVDAVIASVCFALGKAAEYSVGKRVCQGITGLVGEFIKLFIFSNRSLIANLHSSNRLQFPTFENKLVDPAMGIVQNAAMAFNIDVQNTIIRNFLRTSDSSEWGKYVDEAIIPLPFDPLAVPYLWQINNSNLKSATFAYELQTEEKDIHQPLRRGQMSKVWQPVPGRDNTFVVTNKLAKTTTDALNQTGINQPLNISLAEGQALPAQRCIAVPVPPVFAPVPVCWIATEAQTSQIPLGANLIYDVLPPTLDGFVTLSAKDGGYSLAWGQSGDLTFARQKDADGDGLINGADGGLDPDDAQWDGDGDGLSDLAELRVGSNPEQADSDSDGLSDNDELLYKTNPRLSDSDGDGLTDLEEITGWEFVYALVDGVQLKSWVTSNPLSVDADNDSLTDLQEKIYGFHPAVASEATILSYSAKVTEAASPATLLRFEHSVGTTAFADASGFNAPAACADDATCPTAGVAGYYGNGLRFDGSDDQITVTPQSTLANSSFTLAAWVKRDQIGRFDNVFHTGTSANYQAIYFGFRDTNKFQCSFHGNDLYTADTYTDIDWHHWACTYDAKTRKRTIYRDGVQVAQDTAGANYQGSGSWTIGSAPPFSIYFRGTLDDVALFKRVLSTTELEQARSGLFNPTDLIVKPNDQLAYEAQVKNELLNRYANGLLSTNFPASVAKDVPPQTFVIQPQQSEQIAGTVTVNANTASGLLNLEQTATASIQDRRAQSGYAEAWLRFSEGAGATTFADFSGNVPPRNMSCSSATCPTAGQAGISGNGVNFNGTSQHAEIKGIALNDESFTVAFWAKRSVTGGDDYAFGAGTTATNQGLHIGFRSSNKFTCSFYSNDLETNATYTDTEWNHWACTYNASTRQRTIYRNGVQVAQDTASANFQGTGNLLVGKYPGGNHYGGLLDDLRVYKRTLSSGDVAALAVFPVLHLAFDANSSTIADSSGQGNHATCLDSRCPTMEGGVLSSAPRFYEAKNHGSHNDYYTVANDPSLNFNNGNLSVLMWILPQGTGDTKYDGYNQGLIGYDSGDKNAMPSLQRVGRKLRFGFGDASGWQAVTTPNDVLTLEQWQQVGATFDGTTVRFYVNGGEVANSNALSGKKPSATNYQLLIGRSDINWRVRFRNINVIAEGSDGGSDSEATLRLNKENGKLDTFCYKTNLDTGETHELCGWSNIWRPFTLGYSMSMWEEDETPREVNNYADESIMDYTFWGIDENESFDLNNGSPWSWCNSSGNCLALHWDIDSMDAVPFAGRIDELALYQRALSAFEVQALYDTINGGQLLQLDEPPGSQEFADTTGTYKLSCTGNNCPTAGVEGRIGQGLQFVPNQVIGGPWIGGNQQATLSAWFKTSTKNNGLFAIGDNDRALWIDQAGNINAKLDGGREQTSDPLTNARQSSTYQDNGTAWSAARAIDGNYGTQSHTKLEKQAWWQADLAAGERLITKVHINNTLEAIWTRLNNYNLILKDASGKEVWRQEYIQAKAGLNTVEIPNIIAKTIRIELVGENYLHLWEVRVDTRVSQAETITTSGVDYADDKWHHLVYTYGGAASQQKLYVDGQLKTTGTATTAIGRAARVYLGSAKSENKAYTGFFDQIRLFPRGISAQQAQQLYADIPGVLLSFDEATGATTYRDAAGGTTAQCRDNGCPTSGVTGQVKQAIAFDGQKNRVQVVQSSALDFDGPFAFSFWLRPDSWNSKDAPSLIDSGNIKFQMRNDQLELEVFYIRANDKLFMPLPAIDEWHQLIINFTGSALELWRNGTLVSRVLGTQSNDPGALELSLGEKYHGRLDEFRVYKRALAAAEIQEHYRYQAGLVTEQQAFRITVDNDLPTASLSVNTIYLPNRDLLLGIQATDPTSAINKAELGFQKQGSSTITWVDAPRCQDATGTASWCPTFTPSGEGQYTLTPRVADLVTNQATGTAKTVYVDGSAPTIGFTAMPGVVLPTETDDGWRLSLAGSISDPALPGGFNGSGVVNDSLLITLLAPDGTDAGLGTQRATINGSSWTLPYNFYEAALAGTYTVVAQAKDQVGNQVAVTLGSVNLDTTAPAVEVGAILPAVVNADIKLSGTALETNGPADANLSLPFEEAAGATSFLDRHAPINLALGRPASQSSIQVAGGRALAAKFAVDGNTAGRAASGELAQTTSQAQPWWQVDLGFNQRIGQIVLWEATDCCADQLRNLKVFVSATPFSTIDPTQTEAQAGVWSYSHAGAVDGKLIVPVVTSTGQPVSGRYVRVQLLETNSLPLAEVQIFGTQQPVGLCTGNSCPTAGETGIVGSAIKLDGVDDRIAIKPNIALANNSFSVAFWAKRDRTDVFDIAFGSGTTTTNKGLLVGFNSGNSFICSFYGNDLTAPAAASDLDWHHWACTYDATTNQRTLYRDGVQVAQDTSAVDYQGTGDWYIGSTTWGGYFKGWIDDLAIYQRPLDSDEVLRMAQRAVAGVKEVDYVFTQVASGLHNESAPAGQKLYLPLDDSTDSTGKLTALNVAGNTGNGICTAEGCPKTGLAGIRGFAMAFDGADDRFRSTPTFELANNSFSVAFWAKRDRTGVFDTAFGSGELNFNRGLLVGFNSGNRFFCSFYGNDLAAPLSASDLEWHHWTCTYDAATNQRTIYRDGVQVAQDISAADYQGTGDWYTGSTTWGGYFKGELDEVRVFDRPLSVTDVGDLYRGSDPMLHLSFEEGIADDSTWGNATTANDDLVVVRSGDAPAGLHVATFDGNGDSVTVTPPFALANRSFTVALWAKRNRSGKFDYIFNSGAATNYQGLYIGFRDSNVFQCSFHSNDLYTAATYPDTDWHHWACTFDVLTRQRTIYRDGVQVAQDIANQAYQGSGDWFIGNWIFGNSVGGEFDGAMDEFRVYPRALAAGEVTSLAQSGYRATTMTGGPGVTLDQWTATIPTGLEGLYQLDLRSQDQNGALAEFTSEWIGFVDTRSPSIRFNGSSKVTENGREVTVHRFRVSDFNLDPSTLRASQQCEGGLRTESSERFTAPWYLALSTTSKTHSVTVTCRQSTAVSTTLTACDIAGNCATATTSDTPTAAPAALADKLQGFAEETSSASILEPLVNDIVSGEPMTVTVQAMAEFGIQTITFLSNGNPFDTVSFPTASVTETVLSVEWLPETLGETVLTVLVEDWEFLETASAPVTVTVDFVPPFLFVTDLYTSTAYAQPFLTLDGFVGDDTGVTELTLQVADTQEILAEIDEDGWTAAWPIAPDQLPDGEVYTVTATVTDLAGNIAMTTATVTVDLMGPQASPSFTRDLISIPSLPSDGSGVAGLYYGQSKNAATDLESLSYFDGANLSAPVLLDVLYAYPQEEDGHKTYMHLVLVDEWGNQTVFTEGPFYQDNERTPDYLGMNEPDGPYVGRPYREWMENSCTYVGEDPRIPLTAGVNGALSSAQKLHATWDRNAMRITWSGADWDRDGDLFIYLDTVPDILPSFDGTTPYQRFGSNVAYDPFPATQISTQMLLPVEEWCSAPCLYPDGSPDLNRMNADYALWVEENATVHLLRWDNGTQRWIDDPLPDEFRYLFSNDTEVPLSEFYVPFDAVELAYGDAVNLVAFASDNDALRIWSVVPSGNPASSARVVGNAIPTEEPLQFMLSERYSFTLADNSCRTPAYQFLVDVDASPGGLTLSATDDEVRLITPRPAFFDKAYDNVFEGYYSQEKVLQERIDTEFRAWLESSFCVESPYHPSCNPDAVPDPVLEQLATLQDISFEPLAPGQRVTYTLHFQNEAPTIKDVTMYLSGNIEWDSQPWLNGCTGWLAFDLPPSSTEEMQFTGVALGQSNTVGFIINPASSLTPDCGIEQTTPAPPERVLTVGYPTDLAPPSYIAIDAPRTLIGAAQTTIRGTVLDRSPISFIRLEVTTGSDSTAAICADPAGNDGLWECAHDFSSFTDGTMVQVRAKATDLYGNESDFSMPVTLTVDTMAPTVTLDAVTEAALEDGILGPAEASLAGSIVDNYLIGDVELCYGDACELAETIVDPATVPQSTFLYEDLPETPVALSTPDLCGVGSIGIQRTFVVSDLFTTAQVELGLNIAHPHRSEMLVQLRAPDGTTANVVEYGQPLLAANLDLLLTDGTNRDLATDRSVHDLAQPYYDQVRRPATPLGIFSGSAAEGEWTLTLCDTNPAENEGLFNRAQLLLYTDRLPLNTAGSWQFDYAVTEPLDGITQTLTLGGVDSQGNRVQTPIVLTFRADNVAPDLKVTQAVTEMRLRDRQPLFTGEVSDGSAVQSVTVIALAPSGESSVESVTYLDTDSYLRSAGAVTRWQYTYLPQEIGDHTISIVATDVAGNYALLENYRLTVLPEVRTICTDCVADLWIDQSVTPEVIAPGEMVTYTLQVENSGTLTATQVLLVDLLPTDLLQDFAIAGTVPFTERDEAAYVLDLPDMAPGAQATFTIRGRATLTATGGIITNTATIQAWEDRTESNNIAVSTVTVRSPLIAFTQSSYTVAEAGGVATIQLTLSEPNIGGDVLVTYQSSNGTAEAGSDFTAVNQVLRIPAGSRSATFAVPILNDELDEDDEVLQLRLLNPVGARLGDRAQAQLTILDDDPLPMLVVTGAGVQEGAALAEFRFDLSKPSSRPVVLTINTVNNSAKAPDDFVALVDHIVVIPAGSTSATTTVTIVDDTVHEQAELFYLQVSVTNAQILASQVIGAIRDDDDFTIYLPLVHK